MAAVALDAGFGALSTFNGRFRGVFGVTPRAHRTTQKTIGRLA